MTAFPMLRPTSSCAFLRMIVVLRRRFSQYAVYRLAHILSCRMVLPRNRSRLRLHSGHGGRMLDGMAADRWSWRWTGHGIHRGPGRQCQMADSLGDPVADPDETEGRTADIDAQDHQGNRTRSGV